LKRPIPHGGSSNSIRARLGLGDLSLIDFSAPLSPLGPSPRVLEAAHRALDEAGHYPEPDCPKFVERLAEKHGVGKENIIVGAGTTEIISLIAQSLREVLALHAEEFGNPNLPLSHLVEPTYGEYRRASVLNQIRTEIWSRHVLGWQQDFLPRSASGIYWTGHPTSPTGRAWDRDRLLRLVDDSQGLLVVVDEAFLPFLPDEAERTLVPFVVGRPNLLVLRSMTKIHTMPGLRVGYAVGSPDMVTRLHQFQSPWTVTASAEAAALATIEDEEDGLLEDIVELIGREATRMTDRLWDIPGLRPVWPGRERPPTAPALPNFVLVSVTDTGWTAPEIRDELARLGFLVRECSDFHGLEVGSLLTGQDQLVATRGHMRFAVRTPSENDGLLSALEDILASEPSR
jgi:threonine-phosphate decarboxylase